MLFLQVDICSVLPGSEYLISDYIYLHLISEGEQHSTPNLSNTDLYFFSHNAIYEEICEEKYKYRMSTRHMFIFGICYPLVISKKCQHVISIA